MGEYRVDTDLLLAMIDSMSEFERHLEAHLAHVDTTVQHLGSSWLGKAAEAAHAAPRPAKNLVSSTRRI